MPIPAFPNLRIFVLNVGQADTSVILTPSGKVVIIDAAQPEKLVRLLANLGLAPAEAIDLLVITHPHADHFGGANRLAKDFQIKEAILPPFWNKLGVGPPTYCQLVARLQEQKTGCHFLSGYTRWYPDGALAIAPNVNPVLDPNALTFEWLGPTNALISSLDRQGVLDTNHLSIMGRVTWKKFRMVFAADAQMENWASFDDEELLDGGCRALKAAHHGSCRGTQWERIEHLAPEILLVSSNPDQSDNLPDLVGTAIMAKYARGSSSQCLAAVTSKTGTIRITVTPGGSSNVERFGEEAAQAVDLTKAVPLDQNSNPTDWKALLRQRAASLP